MPTPTDPTPASPLPGQPPSALSLSRLPLSALPLPELRAARSLDRALRALAAAGLAADDLDVHAMDEYSHDVVVPVADGLVLVFDTT